MFRAISYATVASLFIVNTASNGIAQTNEHGPAATVINGQISHPDFFGVDGDQLTDLRKTGTSSNVDGARILAGTHDHPGALDGQCA